MKRGLLVILFSVIASVPFSGRAGEPLELTAFAPIADATRRATSLTLYEGLPHPAWEAAQLEAAH
jgi:hypothetical protein